MSTKNSVDNAPDELVSDAASSASIPATFCILPWIHRFTNIGGEIEVCCSSEGYNNAVRDDDGRPLMAPQDLDDERVLNSTFMKKLRLEMLAGKWPELCQRCQVTEAAHGVSRRQNENDRFREHIDHALSVTQPDGTIPVRVVYSDFRPGNLCNLACRMCSPRSSSKWLAEFGKTAHADRVSKESMDEFSSYRWFESDRISPYFKRQIPTLKNLHFAGGEPLISKSAREILELCIAAGRAGEIELSYNTNLTQIPRELEKLWPHFGGVRLYCSIDATERLNEVIRHPSKWEDTDRNLRYIDQNHEALGIKEALVMCTVQVYNVFSLAKLYDYLAENFQFVGQIPCLVDLHTPHFYQTSILPTELKALAARRMEQIEAATRERLAAGKIPVHLAGYLDTLIGAKNFMLMNELQALIPDFLREADSIDDFRKQSIFSLVPELKFLRL